MPLGFGWLLKATKKTIPPLIPEDFVFSRHIVISKMNINEITHKQMVSTARLAGLWYLLLALSGVLGFMVVHPKVFVSDNPTETLKNILNAESVARTRLLLEMLIVASQALAAVYFYKLFKEINSWAAFALCLWGTVNAIVILVSAISIASMISLAGVAQLSLSEKTALVELGMIISSKSWQIGGLFFGLWLIPMGHIVVSSKRMPVWLGRVLIAGGIGYLLQTFVGAIGFKSSYIGLFVLPATIGEFWMVGYLLIFGIRPDDRASNHL
jgi:hypothetical protein